MKLPVNQIILGDCLEIMQDFADNSVDLIFADPPYNAKDIGPNKRKYSLGQMQLPEAEYRTWCKRWFTEAQRISKRIVLTPGIANTHAYPQPNWQINWHKPAAVSFNRYGGFNVWEPIFIYGKLPKGKRLPQDYLLVNTRNFGNPIERQHPCPKPLSLMRKLLDTFLDDEEIVLDPFMGAGTTARAAKDQNKRFIGIELNPAYIELANKRLAQEVLV